MSKLLKLLVVLLVSGGALVGCGGDDDDSGADASAEVDADADIDADLPDVGALAAGACGDVAAAMAAATIGASSAFTGGADDLEGSVDDLARLADSVPSEIKADVELLAEAYGEFVTAFAEAGYDPSSGQPPTEEQMAALSEMADRFDTEDFEAASDNVSEWLAEECDTNG